MTTVIGILLIIMAVFLVISVLMQSSKDHRHGGTVAGGAETFFGKNKGKSLDAMFNKLTTVVAVIFVILVIVLYVIQPEPTAPVVPDVPEVSQEVEVEPEAPEVEGEEAPVDGEEAPVAEGEEAPAEGEDAPVAEDDAQAEPAAEESAAE